MLAIAHHHELVAPLHWVIGPQAKREEDRSKSDKKAVPDIRQLIKPAGMMETRYLRLLSSLCAQTYVMHKTTVRLFDVLATCTIFHSQARDNTHS